MIAVAEFDGFAHPQRNLGVLFCDVDRRGSEAVVQRQDGEDCLQSTRSTEQVSGGSLGRRDGDLVHAVAEDRVVGEMLKGLDQQGFEE